MVIGLNRRVVEYSGFLSRWLRSMRTPRVERLRGVPGVESADPVISRWAVLTLHDRKQVAQIVGFRPGSLGGPWQIESGREVRAADEVVVERGVTILGPTNLPATVPYHASQMYSKNITTFLLHLLGKEGAKSARRKRARR